MMAAPRWRRKCLTSLRRRDQDHGAGGAAHPRSTAPEGERRAKLAVLERRGEPVNEWQKRGRQMKGFIVWSEFSGCRRRQAWRRCYACMPCYAEASHTSRHPVAPVTARRPSAHHGKDRRCATRDSLVPPTCTHEARSSAKERHHETSEPVGCSSHCSARGGVACRWRHGRFARARAIETNLSLRRARLVPPPALHGVARRAAALTPIPLQRLKFGGS
jgi:hypothetical protein